MTKRIFFSAFVFLVGCVAYVPRNLTVEDIRSSEYFRKSVQIPMTIEQINYAIDVYGSKCVPSVAFKIDPKNNKHATIMYTAMGLTKESVVQILDANELNGQTTVDVYSYYGSWTKFADRIVKITKEPTNCDE